MSRRLDPLTFLSRPDKWYLGGGNRLIWTPQFPQWLDSPGFWDTAHYFNYALEPLFTWTLLDDEGRPVDLGVRQRVWDPSGLSTVFAPIQSRSRGDRARLLQIDITEVKSCLADDALISHLRIRNRGHKLLRLNLVAWTIQSLSSPDEARSLVFNKGMFRFGKTLRRAEAPDLLIGCALGMSERLASRSMKLSEGSVVQPHWRLTPFAGNFLELGHLPNERTLADDFPGGLTYLALHTTLDIKPHRTGQATIGFAAAPEIKGCVRSLAKVLRYADPIGVSRKSWTSYFNSIPYFECDDEFLTRYYWYRWYGLRLMTINVKEGNYKHPVVCEGIGYFRAPISYSAPCHVRENKWLRDSSVARGSILTFLDNRRSDGGLRGYIDPHYYRDEMFYHADWGGAVAGLDRMHVDLPFLKTIYGKLSDYARYFDRVRDAEGSGLYDIRNHYETGQEYMHRYIVVDPDADKRHWGKVFRLKGVDVSVYVYQLKKTLAMIAGTLKRTRDGQRWNEGAERIKEAVLRKMWDPAVEMFFDVDPSTQQRTGVKAAVCFYPYMTDIVDESHLPGLKRHLFDPKEFWTRFPVPSSSVDDEFFSAAPDWKGKRMNCPWNGRVWPMTNSHIGEALALTAARFGDDEIRKRAADFLNRYVRMMFFDGDVRLPNCFEHYHPFSGEPSAYRGVDDYQHSWVVDLILQYVAGIRVEDRKIVIDPFDGGWGDLKVEGVVIRGKEFGIIRRDATVRVRYGGKSWKAKAGDAIVVPLMERRGRER